MLIFVIPGEENNDTTLIGQWILNPAKKSTQRIVNIFDEKITSIINYYSFIR